MKSKSILTAILSVSALALTSCGEKSTTTTDAAPPADAAAPAPAAPATSAGVAGGVLLKVEFPPELIEGTPKPVNVPNVIQAPTKAPEFFVPEGTTLLSRGKPVTSSDAQPIIGEPALVTDGDKQAGEGYFVEFLQGLQWVQIDLEKTSELSAVWLWHFHSQRIAFHDVIIQVSDDPEFKTGVTTIYNNDYDESAKLGKGSDRPYIESRYGMVADAKGAKGRYVRLYSNGSTSDEMNRYVEVEVYGK